MSSMKFIYVIILLLGVKTLEAEISVTRILDCLCTGTPSQPFTLTAEGTAGPFTYAWSGPEEYASALSNNNLGDIRFNGPSVKFAELKSYAEGSITGITGLRGAKFRQQFKAYLGNFALSDIENLSYYFDAKKLVASTEFPNAPFANVDEAWGFIAGKFKSIYANPNNQIFETIWMNQALKNQLFPGLDEIMARNRYNMLVNADDFGSVLYEFIKIQ